MSPEPGTRLFYFRASAPEGSVFNGKVSAISQLAALSQLRQKGFQPLRLELSPIRDSWLDRDIGFGGGRRLSLAECEQFCRELALLLDSGIAVAEAVGIMTPSQRSGGRTARFTASIRNGLRLGRSLSEAIDGAGFLVPDDLLPVIRAGETSGALAVALTMLAESYADASRFSRTYSAALAYPALLLVVSLFVFGLIAFFVAPNLASLFTSMGRDMPFAIGVLSSASSFVSGNLVAIGVTLGGFGGALAAGGASRSLTGALRNGLFRLPVVGNAMRWSASRRFAATLRLYLASNVPIDAALPNALVAAGFPGGSGQARRLAALVREGGRLSTSLKSAGFLPRKLIDMIAVGESSGRLVEVLSAVSIEAKNRFEQRMALVSALLAPTLILIVGGLIGTVIFSVFSALLDINNVVI